MCMKSRQFIRTEDGSSSLFVPELNEHYHSIHGALQESRHIFIQAGLDEYLRRRQEKAGSISCVRILEAGFGTGLNAWLSLLYAEQQKITLEYHTLEKYPLSTEETEQLNYPDLFPSAISSLFGQLHQCAWEETSRLSPYFHFHKHRKDFREIDFGSRFDIVYFDAFNPEVQPHLWTAEVFRKFYNALLPEGILVTYCVKGIVKQALREVGFTLKRLKGPPGKREMLRASKTL